MIRPGQTFFTAIGCMDGRVQMAVYDFGRIKFNSEYEDIITEAGLVGYIQNTPYDEIMENFEKKIHLSAVLHKSKGVIVFGHQECAGNPVDDATHKKDVLKSAEFIASLVPKLSVIPVFVVNNHGEWLVEEL